jgi:GTP-binding protein EngB required for normal cell division
MVYKVPFHVVETDPQNQLRVVTIGKAATTADKRILLMGGTGSGKTTWLNGMANHLFGIDRADDFRFKIVTDDDEPGRSGGTSQAFSQTRDVTFYKFEWQPGFPCDFSVVVIDTPGFGDTDGLERDQEIEEHVRAIFRRPTVQQMGGIDAVVFVVQAGNVRMTANQRYIWTRVESLFGGDAAGHLVIATTFADVGEPQVIGAIDSLGIRYRSVLKFNNSSLFAKTSNPESSAHEQMGEFEWAMSIESYRQVVVDLKLLDRVHLIRKQEIPQSCSKALLLQGWNSMIMRHIEELERIRWQKYNLQVYQAKGYPSENPLTDVIVPVLKTRPSSGSVIFCPICNIDCCPRSRWSSPSQTSQWACPRGCNPALYNTVGFVSTYEIVHEFWTIAQLIGTYSDETVRGSDLGKILNRMDRKMHEIHATIYRLVGMARNIANELDPILRLRTDSEYFGLMMHVEMTVKFPGFEVRLSHLCGLMENQPGFGHQ